MSGRSGHRICIVYIPVYDALINHCLFYLRYVNTQHVSTTLTTSKRTLWRFFNVTFILSQITPAQKIQHQHSCCIKFLLRSNFRYLLTWQSLKPKRKLGASVGLSEQRCFINLPTGYKKNRIMSGSKLILFYVIREQSVCNRS